MVRSIILTAKVLMVHTTAVFGWSEKQWYCSHEENTRNKWNHTQSWIRWTCIFLMRKLLIVDGTILYFCPEDDYRTSSRNIGKLYTEHSRIIAVSIIIIIPSTLKFACMQYQILTTFTQSTVLYHALCAWYIDPAMDHMQLKLMKLYDYNMYTTMHEYSHLTFNTHTKWWRTIGACLSTTGDSRFITITDISKSTKNINIRKWGKSVYISVHTWLINSNFYSLLAYFVAGTADAPSIPQFSCRQITVASLLPTSLSQAWPYTTVLLGLISRRPWHLLGPSTSLSSTGIDDDDEYVISYQL